MRKLKEKCKRGHEFTEANTLRRRDGTRQCRACHRRLNGVGVEGVEIFTRLDDAALDVILFKMVALIDMATQRKPACKI